MKARGELLWIVTLGAVLAPLTVLAQNATLLTTIANPTPALRDRFGGSLATMGSDRLVIGASQDDTGNVNAGAVYLFSTTGTLLTTLTNPAPTYGDEFGCAVAAAGSDCIIVGAWKDERGSQTDFGMAYLFSTNGTLLTTVTNPTQANYDYFGYAVAAMGDDGVVIGAYQTDAAATDIGAAYFFNTSGTLLVTFTNPTPSLNDWLGYAVAGLGGDRVFLAAPNDDQGATDAGVVHLISTNGNLLTTFTNPTPATGDGFGRSLAVVGSDRVLVGAYQDDTGATNAGAAYLFTTNASLLTIFTNPTPAHSDYFGWSLAAVGGDRVLVSAYLDDTGASNAGAAYLFRTDGTLLTTLTNPTPAVDDYFGWSVTAVGNDRVLISANQDDSGAIDAGTVYLFSIPAAGAPQLTVTCSNNTVVISWPLSADGWVLEWTNALPSVAAPWPQIPPPYTTNDATLQFTEPTPVGNRFYRLHKP